VSWRIAVGQAGRPLTRSGRAHRAAPPHRPSERSADPHRLPVGLTRQWDCDARVSSVAPREGEGDAGRWSRPRIERRRRPLRRPQDAADRRRRRPCRSRAERACARRGTRRVAGSAGWPAVRRGPRASAPARAARRASRAEHAIPGGDPARAKPEPRALVGSRRPASRGAGRTDAPRRSLPRRQHREDARRRHRAAAERARSAVARRPAARGALPERHRPCRQRGRHHGTHAARPPRRGPGLGRPGARREGRP
jgi:hypothetical protein